MRLKVCPPCLARPRTQRRCAATSVTISSNGQSSKASAATEEWEATSLEILQSARQSITWWTNRLRVSPTVLEYDMASFFVWFYMRLTLRLVTIARQHHSSRAENTATPEELIHSYNYHAIPLHSSSVIWHERRRAHTTHTARM